MNFSEDTLTGHQEDLAALYVNKYKQQKTVKLKVRQQNERTCRMQIQLKTNNLTEMQKLQEAMRSLIFQNRDLYYIHFTSYTCDVLIYSYYIHLIS